MADYAISNVPRRVVYANSGVGPYAFTFEILSQTDISVYRGSTLLTLTTDYSVTINTNGTGSITLVTAGTGNITIVGAKNIQRTTDFTTGGDLFANTLNDELDNQTIFIQQVAETAERGLKAPVTDPTDIAMTLPAKDGRKGKVLAFDSTTGNPVAGPALDAVTTVIEQSANINTVAANISSVNTVAGNTSNINTVAGVSNNVSTVAGSISNVNTVADDLNEPVSEINTVAVNIANVNTVGNNISNVNTVAGISSNVTTVAGISSDVTTVSTNNANVSTVATNIASVNTNATNITAIQNASTNATNAANSASAASTSATNAANSATAAGNAQTAAEAARDATLAAYDNFDDRYLGAKSSNPTLDNDGNALLAGALYYNTTVPEMRLYTGSAWVAAYVSGASYLASANNLSDLSSAATARTNLGLGTAALVADNTLVHTTGNETIGGTKTFSVDASISGLTVGKGGGAVGSNTTAGYNALSTNSAGSQNSAFGYTALYLTTGSSNSAFGSTALQQNTTGSSNSAFGGGVTGTYAGALGNNTTGSYNTAMGVAALALNTTASDNTALGYVSGYSNTTGTQNTYVGKGSGYTNSTSNGNSVLGFNALYYNTGASNTAIGAQALLNNTTASNNTAVGYQAGYSNTTGDNNTFMGWKSGYSVTGVGTGNTFVGRYSGYGSTTSDSNTFIGQNSGYLVTTGSKNTILGGYSGNQSGLDIRTASNYIVLSDGDGNPRAFWDNNGNTYLGKTSTSDAVVGNFLNANGAVSFTMAASTGAASTLNIYSTGAGAYRFYVDLSGKIWCTSTTISGISDERLKENIRDLDVGIDAIMAVKPRRFDWKEGKGQDKKNAVGFVAQEFETVFPDSVVEGKAGEDGIAYKTICHEELIPAMVKAIQELKAEVDSLKQQLASK